MALSLAELRENYTRQTLDESHVSSDPLRQFEHWFQEAVDSQLPEPNAMTLATATTSGLPSARIVLLKGLDDKGFVFFTNYESRKGDEMADNPHAALLFFWIELQRQVRIEGRIEKVSAAESEAYFQSRPKDSQIGAWASPQSRVIASREQLETKQDALTREYADAAVLPCPPFWGGYRLVPEKMEYWQGRPNRLHDRLHYSLQPDGSWIMERLAP
ncbi:MAG: pyridoxamine 5'-phosphate oxidase [Saprospiraceae bacterium]|nr:pyridoxamine 5'-phosphate oxidase [Saprospiraceae bacterium]